MNLNSNWTQVASVLIALLAFLVSVLSFSNSRRALGLARVQEERRKPLLAAALLNSYVDFRSDESGRTYGFEFSISNPTDSDNSVAKAELRVTYTTSTNARLTVQLPASLTRANAFSGLSDFGFLSTPFRLDAHQTLRGWLVFQFPNAILSGGSIELYSVTLIDSHGLETAVEAVMVREYIDEAVSASRKHSNL